MVAAAVETRGDPVTRLADALAALRTVPDDTPLGDPTPPSYYTRELSADPAVRHEAARKQIAYFRDLLQGAQVQRLDELTTLEAGSGFGVGLLSAACLGAERVLGLEIVPYQAEWSRRALDVLDGDLAGRIEVATGSALSMPYENHTADVIFSLEAISHYLDHRPMLAEAHRVLRPGGVLIISDGNNALNPRNRRRSAARWASHEQPPGNQRANPAEWPFHFIDKRRAIALEAVPDLSDFEAHRIAVNTAGMVQAQVAEAARHYRQTGEWPHQPWQPGQVTVHPTHEMVMERLFNLYELGNEVAGFGFDVRVVGHWAGATKRRSLKMANRMLAALGRLTMPTARAFRIYARKNSSS